MTYIRPPFISERETAHTWVDGSSRDDGAWEDCVPCSVLMAVLASGKPAPATHVEAELLREAAGYSPLGGTTIEAICKAADKRYIVDIHVFGASFATLWNALAPGHGAAVIGKPSNLPAAHPLRKYIGVGFTGLHCDYVQREDDLDRVWLMDPTGPTTGYAGQWLSKADLAKFYVGSSGVLPLEEIIVQKAITDTTPKLIDWPDGTPYFDVDGITKLGTAGAVSGRYSPHGCGVQRAFYAGSAPSAKVALVTPSAVHPVPASLTQADVDAARAAGYSAAKTKAASAVQAI